MSYAKAGLLLLLILPLFAVTYPSGKANPGTTVFVDPKESTVKLGQIFNISIKIIDVTGLLGFDFRLSYDAAILQLVDAREGSFLKSIGYTFFINLTTKGNIWLAVALYGPQPLSSANGSGVLATATFKAITACESKLDLYSDSPYKPDEVKLAADPPDDVVPIPNVAIDGHVVVSSDPADPPPDPPPDPPDPPPPAPPVLTAHVFASKTVVGQGYNLPIEVTAANQGDLTETFNVTSYANTTEIGEQTLTLPNGSSTTTSFVWNTNGFPYGNYCLTAHAFVSGQTARTLATNDGGVDTWVTVTIPGDIRVDQIVDILDAIVVGKALGSTPNSGSWNPNADINNDNSVDIYDTLLLAGNYGETA